MDRLTGSMESVGRRKFAPVAALFLGIAAAFAAAIFIPKNQPFGYIAPMALSSANFKNGGAVGYAPWFDATDFRGDISALPVGNDGVVQVLVPNWQASTAMDAQNYNTGRRIVTTDGVGNATAFRYADLTAAQQTALGSDAMLNFIRGDRSGEGGAIDRVRGGVLGDIIHSTPVFVGNPRNGYLFGDYLTFAAAKAGRAERVYVGANDGMLHALDASNGEEVYGYVPSMVMSNLTKLAAGPYQHYYFVDGTLTVEDVQFGAAWHSVLVGGLGAGGKGFFALDVTDPDAADEAAAAGKILWEFNSNNLAAANIGYSYGRPSIVQLDNGAWVAVVANGYLSATGKASLYILNIQTGAVIRELAVLDDNSNGLSSPTLIDANKDGRVDTAYAGDLNGNLWKFDLSAAGSGSWTVAYGGLALLQTDLSGGVRRPITSAPEVGFHPEGGVMVYVGTGRLLNTSDGMDNSPQAVYGVWDNNWGSNIPITSAALVSQQIKSVVHLDGDTVRTVTANPVNWTTKRGWVTPTEIESASLLDQGERVIQDMLLRDGRVTFITVNPTIATGDNWFMQLDGETGGAPSKTIIDVNLDFKLDIGDNADGDANGVVGDTAVDRVIGQYQQFGLASRPVVGVLDVGRDSALINHLSAISPNLVIDAADPGLIGGHFDLDTSHLIYPFSTALVKATTDGHVHQWDDKNNATTIDFMGLPDGNGNPLHEINDDVNAVDPDTLFILIVGNAHLSPGAILQINGNSISVSEYKALQDRYMSGTLATGEKFPLLKINKPTGADLSIKKAKALKSLKVSFDAFAILAGDIVPSETACVRENDIGTLGEYRNGALFLQALDASDLVGGFTEDVVTERLVAGSTAVNSVNGYATRGLMWEASVFWHWDEGCYNTPGYQAVYDACIVDGDGSCFALVADDKKKKGKKKKKKKDPPVVPVIPGNPGGDPGHNVTNTTIGGNNDAGRLFWRELIPED
jgi:hypothetical protein